MTAAETESKTPRRRARAKATDTPPMPAQLLPETVAIADLRLDKRNVNMHNDRNLDVIAGSLRRFGQVKPIVVDRTGTVVAGNGTLVAARDRLGWTHLSVIRFPGSRAEARAYAIADNRASELSAWAVPALAAQLEAMNVELREAAGFDAVEHDDLVAAAAALEAQGSQYGDPEFPGQKPQAGIAVLGQRYANKATRTLFFEYRNDVFVWLTERLAEFREQNDLDSNADAFVAMVATISGQEPPTDDE